MRGGVFVGSVKVGGGPRALGGQAFHSTALRSNSDGWLPMMVVEAARGETWPVSRLVSRWRAPRSMIMGP